MCQFLFSRLSVKKPSQTVPGAVTEKDACLSKHEKSREMPSSIKVAAGDKLKWSKEDSHLCKRCPEMSAAEDNRLLHLLTAYTSQYCDLERGSGSYG